MPKVKALTANQRMNVILKSEIDAHGIRYSDAYEVYGLTRTGCCGCPISYKAVEDLEKIRPFEPNVVRAAWNIFGKSYEYRAKYVEYKQERMAAESVRGMVLEGQLDFFGNEIGGRYEPDTE